MRYKLYREQQLACDLDTAWSFFSSPMNLSEITPKDMGFVVVSDFRRQEIAEGMIIDYLVSPILRFPLKFHNSGAIRERVAIARSAALVRLDHSRIGDDYFEHFVGPSGGNYRPVLVSLEVGECDSTR